MHVHFLPENVQRKVYAQFDQAGPKIGREWPIRYRGSHEERVDLLRAFGVRRFSALPYAHRPGIATYLNDWAAGFARDVPESMWSATFYPEPDARGVRRQAGRRGRRGVQGARAGGGVPPRRPAALNPVWGMLEDCRHADRDPRRLRARSGNEFTGPEPLRRVLARFPRLAAVVAHMGAPEYAEFLALAETHERVCLDTTMVFTDFFEAEAPYPRELAAPAGRPPAQGAARQRLPDHPVPLRPPARGSRRLGLGDDWLRDVCWNNGVRMFGPVG